VFFVEEVDMRPSLWVITYRNVKTGVDKTRVFEFEGPFPLKHEMGAIEDGDGIVNGYKRIMSMSQIR